MTNDNFLQRMHFSTVPLDSAERKTKGAFWKRKTKGQFTTVSRIWTPNKNHPVYYRYADDEERKAEVSRLIESSKGETLITIEEDPTVFFIHPSPEEVQTLLRQFNPLVAPLEPRKIRTRITCEDDGFNVVKLSGKTLSEGLDELRLWAEDCLGYQDQDDVWFSVDSMYYGIIHLETERLETDSEVQDREVDRKKRYEAYEELKKEFGEIDV